MTTPIIMLILMMAPYSMARLAAATTGKQFNLRSTASIGLGFLFIFTGVGHFIQTQPMVQMLPSWLPERTFLVYLTGWMEFAVAVGFFIPKLRRLAGYAALFMLVFFFPANIYAAINHVPMGGHAWGPVYLLIRVPLQIAIAAWVYWFTLKQGTDA